jgi:hypothetical protein
VKKSKAPEMTMDAVARSIAARVNMAVRTASDAANEIANAAKKPRARFPKKSVQKKLSARAKKLVSAADRLRATARKLIRSAKPRQ